MEDGLYYLGETKPQDRAVLVRQVGRLSAESIRQALEAVITQTGNVVVLEDGLVIVAEQGGVLRKVKSVLDGLETVGGAGWLVQVLLIESAASAGTEYGIDSELDIDIASAFSSVSNVTELSASARAALRADIENQRVTLYAQPLFVVMDGGKAVLKRVEVVPIAEYTTLETGAVVTSGYSEIEIGLEVEIALRSWGQGRATIDYDFRLGEILGYVDDRIPIRTEETLTGAAGMKSGGTYLLGSLERGKERRGVSGAFGLAYTRETEATRLEVWCMLSEIGSTPPIEFASTDNNFSIDIAAD